MMLPETYLEYFESPIGLIEIGGTSEAVTSLNFVEEHRYGLDTNAIVKEAARQISEYFQGTRRDFNMPIHFQGTDFQESVWYELLKVPFGRTASYQSIARAIGRPRAMRPVGAANGKNPVAIIVPCHRIIGSDSSLTGYGGGLWRKEWLLRHEGVLFDRGKVTEA